ncbi:hypothetical protein CEF21_19025 [Bacillus sp. FJAT-42376]|uniref:hypothetical protein n=1 Tax=Bacillus sp. FJAT-42376 TaxID=2014076 RepID=UPI000F516E09|nr:hypothetical protein [Bacillus sp. FJAT-42376]AZB44216.1 hypothetical protein CEF21_19025 [Bacillus sp. FJAT-42376]
MGFVLSLFLYFPEDKTEYIPAAFNMAIFLLMAVLVFRMIIRLSKKEEREVNEKYKHMNDEEQ